MKFDFINARTLRNQYCSLMEFIPLIEWNPCR